MSNLGCTEFLELLEENPEILADFLSTVEDELKQINTSVDELKYQVDDDGINSLFRALHTLKGNCEMVFLYPFVALTHRLEDVVADIRAGRAHFHPKIGDFICSACAEVEYLIRQVGIGEPVEQRLYDDCLALITEVCDAEDQMRPIVALNALQKLDGDNNSDASQAAAAQPQPAAKLISDEELSDIAAMEQGIIPPAWQKPGSLGFLKFLSLQRDALISSWEGRSLNELNFCLQLNELLDNPVDPAQLTAAVYMHDVGMAFIPHEVVDKPDLLEAAEFEMVKAHVFSGAQLLKQIGGWDEAAEIVLQHHERYDGSGYPRKLKGDQIHPGAVFIGLADTFGALTSPRAGRGRKKSLMGAMAEINASSNRMFAEAYVDIFNEVVKDNYEHR